jgi:putative transposase
MKYDVIHQAKDAFPVRRLCALLDVSESGYYAWLKHEPSQRASEETELRAVIVDIWEGSYRIYGLPRIQDALRDDGIPIGKHRLARLMGEAGVQGKMPRRKRPRTTQREDRHPVAPNVLNRQFGVTKRNTVWLTDITYIETAEGYLYTAGVMDLASREIVGLAMADHMRTALTLAALKMAVVQQCPAPGLLHHSDRGSQYTSADYQQPVAAYGMIASMSRTGNCLDNAPMESFWATLKRECADEVFPSRQAARVAIFQYVMGFYNRRRRHSVLAYHTPLSWAA